MLFQLEFSATFFQNSGHSIEDFSAQNIVLQVGLSRKLIFVLC